MLKVYVCICLAIFVCQSFVQSKEDVSKSLLNAKVQTGATTESGFDIESLVNGITKSVKKGKLQDGHDRATVLENENALDHKRYDTSIDPEEFTQRLREEHKKVEEEDRTKAGLEGTQKSAENGVKVRDKDQRAALRESQQKSLGEQQKKKATEQEMKKDEAQEKTKEEQKAKEVVKKAVERTQRETQQVQAEMKQKADEEANPKKKIEEKTKQDIQEVQQKAAATRQRALNEVDEKVKIEAAEKQKVRQEQKDKAAAAAAAEEQAQKAKSNAVGKWCDCMAHRTYFDQVNTWQKCPDGFLMAGFYRADSQAVSTFQYYHCCRPCQDDGATWKDLYSCAQADWSRSFDYTGWSRCPDQSYMQGLYKSSCDLIYCIEYAQCCRIQESHGMLNCNQKDQWVGGLDGRGWSLADQDKFLNGLYRSGDQWVYNIELPWQCNFFSNPV